MPIDEILESNTQFLGAWRFFARHSPTGEVLDLPDVHIASSNVSWAMLNVAFLPAPMQTEEALQRAAAAARYFQPRGTVTSPSIPSSAWGWPRDPPAAVEDKLRADGLRRRRAGRGDDGGVQGLRCLCRVEGAGPGEGARPAAVLAGVTCRCHAGACWRAERSPPGRRTGVAFGAGAATSTSVQRSRCCSECAR